MLIGQLCAITGLSKDTIRHYEDQGLICSSRIQAGTRQYRHFGKDTLERLEHIGYAKAVGLTLREIKPPLDAYMKGDMSEHDQQTFLTSQVEHIDRKIEVLQDARKFLCTQLALYIKEE